MKRQLFIACVCAASILPVSALDFPQQDLDYDIHYHCAIIDECAAHAVVSAGCYDDNFNASISGCSISLFGTIYCVSDTLRSSFSVANAPVLFPPQNIEYISGYYRKPHSPNCPISDSPSSYRTIGGEGTLNADPHTMEYVNIVADMLSMFYYAKSVDFDLMEVGESYEVPITSFGHGPNAMQVIFKGAQQCCGRDTWCLQANFAHEDIWSQCTVDVYIDTELRIPLRFASSLSIGNLDMTYTF